MASVLILKIFSEKSILLQDIEFSLFIIKQSGFIISWHKGIIIVL